MTTDLHKWGRLFATFSIILGIVYMAVSTIPDPVGLLNGIKANLIWPAIILGTIAITFGATAFRRQINENKEKE
jgi:hypothetical protein